MVSDWHKKENDMILTSLFPLLLLWEGSGWYFFTPSTSSLHTCKRCWAMWLPQLQPWLLCQAVHNTPGLHKRWTKFSYWQHTSLYLMSKFNSMLYYGQIMSLQCTNWNMIIAAFWGMHFDFCYDCSCIRNTVSMFWISSWCFDEWAEFTVYFGGGAKLSYNGNENYQRTVQMWEIDPVISKSTFFLNL